jgi:hypothetical protein
MLRRDIEQTREQGYALSHEDVTIGVAALGVPLFDYRGEVIGGLSLAGITPRWTPGHMAEMLDELKAMGERISERMGWRRDINDFENTITADEQYGISDPERRKPENGLLAGEKAAVADARRGEA